MYLTFLITKESEQNFTIDDILDGANQYTEPTKTYKTKTIITDQMPSNYNKEHFESILEYLKDLTTPFRKETIDSEYNTFYIPKKTGGLREINAPKQNLMQALKAMQYAFQYKLKTLAHNCAYAYVQHRSTIDALKKHQERDARWFLKLDIKDFFPSCNQEFVVKSLLKIYPFSTFSKEDIESFIWICFRENQLPQGTPMSPLLTNLIMIPIDYTIQQYAVEHHLTYTRYADDIIISNAAKWDWRETVSAIENIFINLNAPFTLKQEKTRFGSSAGRNWNLGLMYNKDKQITIGYKKKKQYKAMLNNLLISINSENPWKQEDLYYFQGITSYYLSIEPEYFTHIISKYEKAFNITLKEIYKLYL